MRAANVPSAKPSCMPASSAPTSRRASGSNARSRSRSASPTSAPATSAASFRFVQPLSAKPHRDQGALTILDGRSTISSRSSEPRRAPTVHGHAPRHHRRYSEPPRRPQAPVQTTQPLRAALQTHQESIVMSDPKFYKRRIIGQRQGVIAHEARVPDCATGVPFNHVPLSTHR